MATAKKPGTLVLLRHGQSTWNLENLFTGWTDVPLSELGVTEAVESGRLMKEAGLAPGVVHTSVLVRAIQTADIALHRLGLAASCSNLGGCGLQRCHAATAQHHAAA